MKVIKKRLDDLKHPEKNVRIHSEQQIRELKRSLEKFGQTRALVVDENNVILIGNGLYEAMVSLGYQEASVYVKTELSENDKKKLMIADNKTYALGIDNLDTLNEFLEELQGDLDIPGYDEEILQQMVADADEVTEKISEYGTLDESEIQKIKEAKENTMDNKLSAPSRTMHWVDRNKIKPNDYNPNKVSRQNLELLTQSIFTNGWTLPIVVRPDGTIIDGFHRWTVAGPDWKYVPPSEEDDRRTLYERLEGKVLVVIVDHKDKAKNIYGTVTHNRARGTHLLEPMKKIVKELMDEGKTVEEIGKQLGMRPEEIFRLSDFSKEDFLKMMTKGVTGYSKAEFITKI